MEPDVAHIVVEPVEVEAVVVGVHNAVADVAVVVGVHNAVAVVAVVVHNAVAAVAVVAVGVKSQGIVEVGVAVVVGVHNAVAVVAIVEHNVVAAVAVVAVGVESQGIVEVGIVAVVEGFAFFDTSEKQFNNIFKKAVDTYFQYLQSLLLPFVLVRVDTDVAALGAVPEKHNAGVVVAVVVQNAVVVVAATVVVGNNVEGLITATRIIQ